MLQIKRIVFATDDSATADQAAGYAQFFAQIHDATLDVVRVVEDVGANQDIDSDVERDEPGSHSWDYDELAFWRVRYPKVSEGILAFANNREADLIVMGTHGRTGVRRLIMGSVAEQVIRLAACPVLTVRKKPADVDFQSDTLAQPQDILVPLDFSQHAKQTLLHALELSETFDARLHLLHIIEQRAMPRAYGTGPGSLSLTRMKKDAHHALTEMSEQLTIENYRVHVVTGYASDDIGEWANEHGSDLIVIGSHGRGGLERMLLGSVTERVVRFAQAPVFTLKSFGKRLVTQEIPAWDL